MPTSWLCSWMASTWSFATKIVCARLASMWSSDFAATAKSKSLPAYHAPVAKSSKTGSSCCATCWNAASVGFFSWCRTTFPDSSPLPKACSPTPTSSFVSCICNAMPKLISPSRMLPSSSSAGGLSKSSWNLEVANQQFEQLCDRFAKNYSTFIAELRKKRLHYLAFLNYPEIIRRSLSTTNVVEAINGQLEIMRRNSGGYFHSQETLKLKLGLAVSSLEQGRWKSLARNIAAVLHQFNAIFQSRFETAA